MSTMNSGLALPEAFDNSYREFESYPCNDLLFPNTYRPALESHRVRLQSSASRLFTADPDLVDVYFRDFDSSYNGGYRGRAFHTEEKLKEYLGDKTVLDLTTGKVTGPLATKRDPKCRFIYFYGDDSKTHLRVSLAMFTRILTYHQVMPIYLDFVSAFGLQRAGEPNDLRFSSFREQTMLDPSRPVMAVPELRRSGCLYQLSYNLKSVTEISRDILPRPHLEDEEWSIRQAAIHHQFDVNNGTTLWIVTKGHTDLLEIFKEMTGSRGRAEDASFGSPVECFRSSLAIHLMLCYWSTEGWRYYIRRLESIIERRSRLAVDGSRADELEREEWAPEHYQSIQQWEDTANEAVVVMETNIRIKQLLSKYYDDLSNNTLFPLRDSCRDDIVAFSAKLMSMIEDERMQIDRAKLLVRITSQRKVLIQQHMQSQATDRMERLSSNMERESVIVRIITVVPLIYLPATFVSTFFSTDVVKYQDQAGGPPGNGKFSYMALYRWLEVALPLTLLTLAAAFVGIRLSARRPPRPCYDASQVV